MGLLQYSEGELRDLLARAVQIRWPGEHVLILTSCHSETPGGDPFPTAGDLEHPRHATSWGSGRAVLAATASRLIYQERTTHAVLLKALAAVLTTAAIATLFLGTGLGTFAALGLAGLATWAVAKLVELFTVGRTSIEFHRVDMVDRLDQRIDGTVPPGMAFRIRVPDPSDFGMIASLVNGYGRNAA
jgi:hypothetical protein